MADFPSLKARELLRILQRKPLDYAVTKTHRGGGGSSHRKLVSPNGYPPLGFAFHDSVEVGGTMVKKILMNGVGLSEDDAMKAIQGKLS